MSDRPSTASPKRTVRLTFDRCARHRFEAIAIVELDADNHGTGTRLVGPKSCCCQRREVWRSSPLSAQKLRDIAEEILEYAERAASTVGDSRRRLDMGAPTNSARCPVEWKGRCCSGLHRCWLVTNHEGVHECGYCRATLKPSNAGSLLETPNDG